MRTVNAGKNSITRKKYTGKACKPIQQTSESDKGKQHTEMRNVTHGTTLRITTYRQIGLKFTYKSLFLNRLQSAIRISP